MGLAHCQSALPTHLTVGKGRPPSTGLTPVPTRYAGARAGELADSFDLFLITKLVMDNTNLPGEKDAPWCHHHVAYFGILLFAGVYWSHSEVTRILWDDQTSRHIFGWPCPSKLLHWSAESWVLMTGCPDHNAGKRISWLLSGKSKICGLPLMFNQLWTFVLMSNSCPTGDDVNSGSTCSWCLPGMA